MITTHFNKNNRLFEHGDPENNSANPIETPKNEGGGTPKALGKINGLRNTAIGLLAFGTVSSFAQPVFGQVAIEEPPTMESVDSDSSYSDTAPPRAETNLPVPNNGGNVNTITTIRPPLNPPIRPSGSSSDLYRPTTASSSGLSGLNSVNYGGYNSGQNFAGPLQIKAGAYGGSTSEGGKKVEGKVEIIWNVGAPQPLDQNKAILVNADTQTSIEQSRNAKENYAIKMKNCATRTTDEAKERCEDKADKEYRANQKVLPDGSKIKSLIKDAKQQTI